MFQKPNTKIVVVTGAAGYIGGMTCIELKKQGYEVIGVDQRHTPHLDSFYDEFICCDFSSYEAFNLYKKVYPCAIIHCAGTSLVGPSIKDPGLYFENNVSKTTSTLKFINDTIPNIKFIFSSSAAVYGNPISNFIKEDDLTNPVSPYGESKLMVEKMLHWYNVGHGLKYVAFRYFNAAGAEHTGLHGQEPGATHIIAKLFDAILNDKIFTLNGWDYPTSDGTCVRDYIHVADIATAHVMAIDNNINGIYNLGSFAGYTNLEIQTMVERIVHKKVVTTIAPKREGDPASLIADSYRFRALAGWNPKNTLDGIIRDVYTWYTSNIYKTL